MRNPNNGKSIVRIYPQDFYLLHFFQERGVTDRNPVGYDDGGREIL